MAKEGNKPGIATKEIALWSSLRLLAFTLFGALTATFLSSRYSPISPNVSQHAVVSNPPAPNTIDISKVKILSFDPFIAHITDFVSAPERAHLLAIGAPLLSSSIIIDSNGAETPSPGRTSSTAYLPASDPVIQSIAARAASFQGYLDASAVDVQITAYRPGQQYKHHYDWYPPPRATNRLSTFFAILKASCTACGTEFPFLNISERAHYDARWCGVLDCDSEMLTTLNVEGSALFWVNLDAAGEGRLDLLHAGLPATGGEKVGLNVWTELGVQEVQRRGIFGGQRREFWRPTREFLERYELVRPESEG